ncbi:MAG: ABC transporter substrate-binding protein [Oscillospiraceae bacterium]|nr:ABC transporter substrate-binding protein [Oscillospiraceae bacterium]
MNKIRKIISVLLCFSFLVAFAACGTSQNNSETEDAVSITVAYQGGIGYAPIHIMEKLRLIEKNYGKDITVTYTKLDSGPAINEGIIGGTIQVGAMGLSPAISAVAAGVPCKIISSLCSQSHGLMTNSDRIKTLSDIKPEDKIALVSTGSIQHILLSMAAEKELGDAHALDNNIQSMAHAEGMAALESGTVTLHLTSAPFINLERESGKYTELDVIEDVWPTGNTFLVATAAESLKNDNPELFEAITKSIEEAINYINENVEETIEIESEYLALEKDVVKGYLDDEACRYFTQLRGADKMVDFMYRAGFISNKISAEDLTF